ELVVLPELCDSGYVFNDEAEARKLATPAADSPTLREWQALAQRYRTTIAGGFCELGEDGLVYNSAAFVSQDGVLAVYRKAHLRERRVHRRGGPVPCRTGGVLGRWHRHRGTGRLSAGRPGHGGRARRPRGVL